MKFTYKELASIENTVEKLYTVTRALTASDSTDAANMRALSYIVSTLRNSADVMRFDDGKEAAPEMVMGLFSQEEAAK